MKVSLLSIHTLGYCTVTIGTVGGGGSRFFSQFRLIRWSLPIIIRVSTPDLSPYPISPRKTVVFARGRRGIQFDNGRIITFIGVIYITLFSGITSGLFMQLRQYILAYTCSFKSLCRYFSSAICLCKRKFYITTLVTYRYA